jgi:hypothetical protein
VTREIELVAVRTGPDQAAAQDAPQLGHVGLDRGAAGAGWLLAPEPVGKRIGIEWVIAFEEQDRQQATMRPAIQRQLLVR